MSGVSILLDHVFIRIGRWAQAKASPHDVSSKTASASGEKVSLPGALVRDADDAAAAPTSSNGIMEGARGGEGKIVPFPYKAFQHILQFLGPIDLTACRNVSRAWREEVMVRAKVLKTYHVDSMETLQEAIELLKAGPGRSPLVIQELYLSTYGQEDFDSTLLRQFILSMSGPSLGRLRIWIGRHQVSRLNEVQEFLRRNPNLFHLQYADYITRTFDCSFLFQSPSPGVPERVMYFPSLQKVKMRYHGCSLATILRVCPNLRDIVLGRLEAPFVLDVDGSKLRRIDLKFLDFPTCSQLRDLNLSLTHFFGIFNYDTRAVIDLNDHGIVLRLVQLFRQFLETQAPTLQVLSLINEGANSDLFPCPLPHLIELKITLNLVSDFNQILVSAPKLRDFDFHPQWYSHRGPLLPSLLPNQRINAHHAIKKLRLPFQIQAWELGLIGAGFQNLSTLKLCNVPHDHLSMVYTEMTQLNVLHLSEQSHLGHVQEGYVPLHDSDFIETYPGSPYVGRMRNLKELEITFRFNLERGDSSPFITDSILTHGIFDIVTQLSELSIRGARFSAHVLEECSSYMDSVNYQHQTPANYFYRKTNYDYLNDE